LQGSQKSKGKGQKAKVKATETAFPGNWTPGVHSRIVRGDAACDEVRTMPSPFPGMDPYLEDAVLWPGLHAQLIASARAALNAVLSTDYVANTGERLYVVQIREPFIEILSVKGGRRVVTVIE